MVNKSLETTLSFGSSLSDTVIGIAHGITFFIAKLIAAETNEELSPVIGNDEVTGVCTKLQEFSDDEPNTG